MKDPAILFYTSDFLTGTMTMTDDQVGKYIRLLCLQHQKGRLTEKDMLFICKSYDKDIYDKFIINGDGRYYNERMEKEIQRRLKYSESRSSNRKAKIINKEDMSDISISYDKHMETENENINEIDNTTVFKEKGGMGEKTWRTDFQVYLASATEAFNNLLLDAKFISEREKYCPGVDISLTLEKAFFDFWGTENGWKYKKKSNVKEIDWKQTFRNAIDQKPNRVYKQRETSFSSGLNKRVNLFDENN